MHKTIEDICRVRRMMETLTQWQENEIAKGPECFDWQASGATIDMIKDLAEGAEKMMKAKYYEMLICSLMMEDEELHEVGRMGYDNWHYASGKFAPKGHGHRVRSGYMPYPYDVDLEHPGEDSWAWRDVLPPHMRIMGYDGDRPDKKPGEVSERSPYGDSYQEYKTAKRHYTESHDMKDAHHMNQKIQEANMKAGETMREMWVDANPETREKMRVDVTNMLKEWERGK